MRSVDGTYLRRSRHIIMKLRIFLRDGDIITFISTKPPNSNNKLIMSSYLLLLILEYLL